MNSKALNALAIDEIDKVFYAYDRRNLTRSDYKINIHKAGSLYLSDNYLSITDVFHSDVNTFFDLEFKEGFYELYFVEVLHIPSNSARIIYSVIDFEKSVNNWKVLENKKGEEHVLSIDSGICYYRTANNTIIDVHEHFESKIINIFEKISFDKPSYIRYDVNNEDTILFSTAFGDGRYRSYKALDENNNLAMVLTDFSGN